MIKMFGPGFLGLIICVATTFLLTACGQEHKDHGNHDDHKDHHIHHEMESTDQVFQSESIYQLNGEWHSQENDTLQLGRLKGKIPIITMAFTHCEYACPRLVADMKQIEEQVPEDMKDEVVFVLASFDTERDHPARLREYARDMGLGEDWLLLHGDEETVRELSMVLNVKYKKQPDGDYAHSNNITLLNTEGVIIEQIEGLGADAQPIVSKLSEI